MAKVYSQPAQGSTCRTGLAVYRTDEKNFKPYISSGAVQEKNTDDSEGSEKLGFTYHQGKILDSYYYANLTSTNHEYDYSDMSDNATFKVEKVDKKRYYKGVRLSLLKEWEDPNKNLTWNDLKPVINGFITEQTFSEEGVEVKVNGYSKLLDQKFTFDFKSMKRSKILEEIIKTAGLTPVIDVKGLDDDVTNFSNKSESKSDSGSSSGLAGGEGETVDNLVKKIVGSETNDLKKCKLVHQWLKENVKYHGHSCTWYHTPEKCLEHKHQLNCADTALLTRAMMSSAGLDAWVVHRSSNNGHFWTLIKIDGKIYASDQTGSGSDFNTIWYSDGDRRQCNSRGGNWDVKNGKKPDC